MAISGVSLLNVRGYLKVFKRPHFLESAFLGDLAKNSEFNQAATQKKTSAFHEILVG